MKQEGHNPNSIYLSRVLQHGARAELGSVKRRIQNKETEIAKLKRCLAFRDDASLNEALHQLAEAQVVIESMRSLIQTMWDLDCGRHITPLQTLVPTTLSLQPSFDFLATRDRERDAQLLEAVATVLLDGLSLQELADKRRQGNWVPKV